MKLARPRAALGWVTGLTLAAWGLLLFRLSQQSLWVDEWVTLQDLQPGWAGLLPRLILNERRPPLYWVMLKAWASLVGPDELPLRVLAAVIAVLLVPAIYRLGRRVAGERTAVAAAGLAAFSPFAVLYGRMLRSYMFFALLAVVTTWALLRLVSRPAPWRWLTYFVLLAALLYTDYVALAVAAAHAVWLALALWRPGWMRAGESRPAAIRSLRRASLIAMTALAAGCLAFWPWVRVARSQAALSLLAKPADLGSGLLGVLVKVGYPFVVFGTGQTLYPWNPLALAAIVVSGLLALVGLAALWQRSRGAAVLVAAFIGGSIAFTALLLSTVAADISFLAAPGRVPHLAPAFGLLVAAGQARLRRRAWRVAALVVLGATSALGLGNYYLGREFHNPVYAVPIRQVAAEIKAAATARDLIIAEDDTVFGYYYRQGLPGQAAYLDAAFGGNQAEVVARSPERVWLLALGRDHSSGALEDPEFLAWLAKRYPSRTQQGYAQTSAFYRAVKERLLHRPAYEYKLTVTRYGPQP